MSWQPIETAPKDGSDIYVWPQKTRTFWADLESDIVRKKSHPDHRWVDSWSEYWEAFEVLTTKPTHWMPLPEPPKEAA